MKEACIVLTMPQSKLQSLYTALDALLDGGDDETARSSMEMMLEVRRRRREKRERNGRDVMVVVLGG
jgi:hypothetical protein